MVKQPHLGARNVRYVLRLSPLNQSGEHTKFTVQTVRQSMCPTPGTHLMVEFRLPGKAKRSNPQGLPGGGGGTRGFIGALSRTSPQSYPPTRAHAKCRRSAALCTADQARRSACKHKLGLREPTGTRLRYIYFGRVFERKVTKNWILLTCSQ